jgi:hypothetical protein
MSLVTFRNSFLSGLLLLLAGLLVIPIISEKLKTTIQIWNNRYIRVIIPVVFFIAGMTIYGNTPEVVSKIEAKEEAQKKETEKIERAKESTETRRNYTKNFIQNDFNVNGLARFIDSCRLENESYTGTFQYSYITEQIDSINGNSIVIFDPKFDLKGDEEYLRKTQGVRSLKNYVVRFDFSSNNKNIITSTVITYTNNQTVVFAQNETPNFNHFINRRKAKDLIGLIKAEKEAERRTVEFKKRKEQFEENHGDDAERQLKEKAKENIGNPSSFEYVEARVQVLSEGKVKVIMRYRYENSFGGVSVANITGYFSDEGKLIEYSL